MSNAGPQYSNTPMQTAIMQLLSGGAGCKRFGLPSFTPAPDGITEILAIGTGVPYLPGPWACAIFTARPLPSASTPFSPQLLAQFQAQGDTISALRIQQLISQGVVSIGDDVPGVVVGSGLSARAAIDSARTALKFAVGAGVFVNDFFITLETNVLLQAAGQP